MTGLPVGRCPNCGAAVSYFAWSCPNCHAAQPAQSRLQPPRRWRWRAPGRRIDRAGLAELSQRPRRRTPRRKRARGLAASVRRETRRRTMAGSCRRWPIAMWQAKHKSDTLNFLIIPVTATGVSLPGWSPTPSARSAMPSRCCTRAIPLIGLRNRALALYQKPLTFAVSDPATKTRLQVEAGRRRDGADHAQTRLARAHARISRFPDAGQGDRMGPHDQSHQGDLLLDQSADSAPAPRSG